MAKAEELKLTITESQPYASNAILRLTKAVSCQKKSAEINGKMPIEKL
tara:strand:+ start:27 stop:170 length:144 start_codon:yes stop_codon:yes gene_type:complete